MTVYVKQGNLVTKLSNDEIPQIYFDYGFLPATEQDYNEFLANKSKSHSRHSNKPHSFNYDEYRQVVVFDQSDPFGKW